MTHNYTKMISIALYRPDIPQNTASILRLSACFKMKVHIIKPCGFSLEDRRFKRVIMDYINLSEYLIYEDFDNFLKTNSKSRVVLMTTKGTKDYNKFNFKKNDILLFGRESAGVPIKIHRMIKNKIKIPINKQTRSLNVAMSVAIASSEALRQNNFLK